MLGLFAKPKRRRSSSGGGGRGGSKALDNVILIGGLGLLGVGAYVFFKGKRGFDEALDTAGDFLKNATDAINSTGDWIGDSSYNIQKGIGGGIGKRGGEEFSVIGGIQDAIGGYSKGVEREIQRNEERSLISRDDILGFGCGWLRKC